MKIWLLGEIQIVDGKKVPIVNRSDLPIIHLVFDLLIKGPQKRIEQPLLWGSDFCSKNGQKYWYLQCFVTKVGLKPLF